MTPETLDLHDSRIYKIDLSGDLLTVETAAVTGTKQVLASPDGRYSLIFTPVTLPFSGVTDIVNQSTVRVYSHLDDLTLLDGRDVELEVMKEVGRLRAPLSLWAPDGPEVRESRFADGKARVASDDSELTFEYDNCELTITGPPFS